MRRAVDIPDGLGVDELMRMAVEATRGTYPHPNPRVGAILVTADGAVLASGVHERPGTPHAEIVALNAVQDADRLVGATVIVTLEPCSHIGLTPPCADALIDAGIAHVIVGALDPDPRVSGAGVERLRGAGITVDVGIEEDLVVSADPGYFHHRRTGRPLVTLKLATTLDGQAAAADGTSQWITREEARRDAHVLRSEHDAIVVGAGTVITDNPALTVRLDGYRGPQPMAVVVTGTRTIPSESEVLARNSLVFGDGTGRVDIPSMVKELGSMGILSVMVEGGPTLAASFLKADCVDRIVWYVGARIAGGVGLPAISGVFGTISDAADLTFADITRIGPDIRIVAALATTTDGETT